MILVYNLSLEQMCQSFIFNFFTLVHFPFFFHFPCFIKSMLRLYKNTFVIIKYSHYTIHIIFFMFHEKCIIKQCFIRIYKLSQNKIERKTKSIKRNERNWFLTQTSDCKFIESTVGKNKKFFMYSDVQKVHQFFFVPATCVFRFYFMFVLKVN